MLKVGVGGKCLVLIHGKIDPRIARDQAFFKRPGGMEHRVCLGHPNAEQPQLKDNRIRHLSGVQGLPFHKLRKGSNSVVGNLNTSSLQFLQQRPTTHTMLDQPIKREEEEEEEDFDEMVSFPCLYSVRP